MTVFRPTTILDSAVVAIDVRIPTLLSLRSTFFAPHPFSETCNLDCKSLSGIELIYVLLDHFVDDPDDSGLRSTIVHPVRSVDLWFESQTFELRTSKLQVFISCTENLIHRCFVSRRFTLIITALPFNQHLHDNFRLPPWGIFTSRCTPVQATGRKALWVKRSVNLTTRLPKISSDLFMLRRPF